LGEIDVSTQDRRFFEMFSIVLGALVLFTIIIFFVANHIAGATQVQWVKEESASTPDQQARLEPVGRVAITGEAAPEGAPAPPPGPAEPPTGATPPGSDAAAAGAAAAASTTAAAPAAAMWGEEVYNGACFACHATGAAGAPKLGDKADWGPRIAQGEETLVKHAIEGFQGQKGIMPPKGGRVDFSDEAVKAAVEYMLSKAQ
jgi:cytochrome c5